MGGEEWKKMKVGQEEEKDKEGSGVIVDEI